jgi:hypothetical protein
VILARGTEVMMAIRLLLNAPCNLSEAEKKDAHTPESDFEGNADTPVFCIGGTGL